MDGKRPRNKIAYAFIFRETQEGRGGRGEVGEREDKTKGKRRKGKRG